jgi:uncharacterized protein (TIGR02145 family)
MRLTLTTFAVLFSVMLSAQAPVLIPYQAVARDASGQALNNATINARFTILDVSATGTAVWQELQTATTSALGLFTVQLGSSVALSNVNWANGSKFMQVEIDLGQGFVDIGTQQMLSVPYALYSGGTDFRISDSGDTLFMGNGRHMVIPGLSANNPYNGNQGAPHSCGTEGIHNPGLAYGSMTDQEGNIYKTIVIGTQEWMAENLNTSIYRNGDSIVTNLNIEDWSITTNGAWAYCNNDVTNACPYGKLYNWFACTDARNLCPTGWHVPSIEEWRVLVEVNEFGFQLKNHKSTGTVLDGTGLWSFPNEGATNSSGFSGVPGGYSTYGGNDACGEGGVGTWWSSTESYLDRARNFILQSDLDYGFFENNYPKQWGCSVRCLKD